MKIIDVGFGRKTLFELFNSTKMSSRWFYGMIELSSKYDIEYISWEKFTIKGNIINNLKMLKKCDILVQSYLYAKPFYILALLRLLGLYKGRKLIGISHTILRTSRNKLGNAMLRMVYHSFDKILFHSKINMEESIQKKLVMRERCEFLYWGDDLDYIDQNISISQGKFFLSTGRECRDFPTLISAFSKYSDIPLYIYTNKINYGLNYDYLEEEQGKYSNIIIEFVEKSAETTLKLAQKAAECLCVVIPLNSKDINYCLGLTSVVEAMALGKPIISTRNPYSPVDLEKEGIGIFVDDEESWIKAINFIYYNPIIANEMGVKARKLAEDRFNIHKCAEQIDRIISSF